MKNQSIPSLAGLSNMEVLQEGSFIRPDAYHDDSPETEVDHGK